MAKEKMVAGGRGGTGNMVPKDKVAPPPAPLEPCLEVETARDRLTTHGRGGKGNQFWHVLAEGVFMTIVRYEQEMVLGKRTSKDDSPKSPKSSPLDGSGRVARMGSPMSDKPSLCHTESTCKDGPSDGPRPRRGDPLKCILWLARWKRKSTSPSPDHGTTVISADFDIRPVTPIDQPASPVSVASYKDALSPLSGPLDSPSSAL